MFLRSSSRWFAALLVVFAIVGMEATARAANPFVASRNIPYSDVAPKPYENKLDIYRAPERADKAAPVLVWVHGGGWYKGSKNLVVAAKARRFINSGFIFVSVNYRLSPRVTDPDSLAEDRVMFPDQPNDVAAAIGWIDKNIGRFGGDPDRLVLMGHSAGGHLVSLVATQPRFLRGAGVDPGQVEGVISLDAVGLGIRPLTAAASKARSDHIKPVYWNAFGTPAENRELDRWKRASPLEYAGPRDPPFFFVVQNDEPLRVRESKQMARRLDQRVDPSVLEVPLTHRQINHTFAQTPNYGATRQAMDFARGTVRRATSGPERG
ncbi:MAG: alpha/beta hydrolase [Solirubrobacterales bacterium]